MLEDNQGISGAESRSIPKFFCKQLVHDLCFTYPKSIYFLLINTMLEAFYAGGFKSVVVIYVKEELGVVESEMKYLFHLVRASDIGAAVVGAFLADMYIGKFFLIVPVDFLAMAIGLTLALSAYKPFGFTTKSQLNIGIACLVVAKFIGLSETSRMAFPGDQFDETQTHARDQFYAAIYFMYYVGTTTSAITIPRIRADVNCIDNSENCFPAAFGIPLCVSFVGTIVLFAGYPFYKLLKPSKKNNWDLIKCFGLAVYRRLSLLFTWMVCHTRSCKHNRDHWLDLADDKYDATVISDLKVILHLVILYTAFPMFWALYEQQSTLWTMMSSKMDGRTVFGQILPDQMDFLTPLLVLFGVLLFTFIVYPLCKKIKFLRRPLERMGYGLILAALSFAYGGCINLEIERGMPRNPKSGVTDIVFHNAIACNVTIELATVHIEIEKYKSAEHLGIAVTSSHLSGNLTVAEQHCSLGKVPVYQFEVKSEGGSAYSVIFAMDKDNKRVKHHQGIQKRLRDNQKNAPQIRFIYIGKTKMGRGITLKSPGIVGCAPLLEELTDDDKAYHRGNSVNEEMQLCYYMMSNTMVNSAKDEDWTPTCPCEKVIQKYIFLRGGIYDVLIIENDDKVSFALVFATSKPDHVPILLQVPMYAMMATGTILCLITGYSFAYSESPETTKCILQAVTYISLSLGNLIVFTTDIVLNSIESRIHLSDAVDMPASAVFFVYTVMMILDVIYYIFLARRYTYINPLYQSLK